MRPQIRFFSYFRIAWRNRTGIHEKEQINLIIPGNRTVCVYQFQEGMDHKANLFSKKLKITDCEAENVPDYSENYGL